MNRLLLFSILLVVVYSWEEFKYTLRALARGFARNKNNNLFTTAHLDSFVSSLIMLTAIPIITANLLAININLTKTLFTLAWQMIAVSIVASMAGMLIRIMRAYGFAGTTGDKTLIIATTLVGFALPFRIATGSAVERKILARFAFLLSLPLIIGLALRLANGALSSDILPNMDLLIRVMVIAMFIHIVVNFLESHTRHYRLGNLSVYFRIVLGIVITTILIMGSK